MHKIKHETRIQIYFMRADRILCDKDISSFSNKDYAIRLCWT